MAYLGENIKKLGFGLMRLPKDGDVIDVEQTKAMVDLFMDAGFTYFDTAWAYAGSEDAIRQALVERYPRDSFTLATKNAAWINCRTREDAMAQLDMSLKRCGVDYFDFYLLHNLGDNRTHFFEDFDLWSWARQKKEEGIIRHLGFSCHGSPEELEDILNRHPEAEFVQLQINYADWEDPKYASRRMYEICRKYEKPVVIMEPVKGGMLATPPQSVKDIFKAADPEASVASWAVRFAADLPGIITVLSGMSNVAQMQDNLSYMKDFKGLTPEQKDVIEQARQALAAIPLIPCTSCNYCAKVCPMDIGISQIFGALNTYTLYGNKEMAGGTLRWSLPEAGRKRATECIRCGQCEETCPQHIEIRDLLAEAAELFG